MEVQRKKEKTEEDAKNQCSKRTRKTLKTNKTVIKLGEGLLLRTARPVGNR